MEEVIQFKRVGRKQQVAVATLVREKPLNSLLLDTIDQLADKINEWLTDDSVACIVLNSSSERAFCAGADITVLYRAIKEANGGDNPYAEAFFLNEYKLNYALHTATKPIIAWGQGIVLGGGWGLLGGCSHRVGTPSTRIAMPEINIGLFPDAGGTKFLSTLGELGMFAGLTGFQMSAGDGLDLKLLDFVVDPTSKGEILEGLESMQWASDEKENGRLASELLERFRTTEALPRKLVAQADRVTTLIKACLAADNFFDVFESAPAFGDEALDAAMTAYKKGCATTARIFVEQMRRAKGMSLADMFRMELVIAYQCIRHADFTEGVRALLIDKDRKPNWTYKSALDVPDSHVAAHFVPAWSGAHPLDVLGV